MEPPTFYVHIIESPSPEDLLDGISEGATLCNFLHIAGIPYLYNLVVDQIRLQEALSIRVTQGIQHYSLVPVIHVAAHGGEDGIQLTDQRKDGGIVKWQELGALLAPINAATGGKLGLGLSCCRGRNAKTMARVARNQDVPVSWIVGTEQNASYCDLALAFVCFYRALQRGDIDPQVLFDSIHALTGVTDFDMEFGEVIQKQYSDDLARRVLEILQKLQPPQPPGRYQFPPGLPLAPLQPRYQPSHGLPLPLPPPAQRPNP